MFGCRRHTPHVIYHQEGVAFVCSPGKTKINVLIDVNQLLIKTILYAYSFDVNNPTCFYPLSLFMIFLTF